MDESWLAKAYASNHSSRKFDPVGHFIRGLISLRSNQYRKAIDHFNLVTKFAPTNAAVLNNIGVAYYRLGNLKKAKQMFEVALKYGQREAIVHYNYSQVLNDLFEYDLAEEELSKASALDFGLARSLLTSAHAGPVPMNLQTRVLWQLAFSSDNDYLHIGYHPVEADFAGRLILIALVLGCGYLASRFRIAASCDICDRPIGVALTRRRSRQTLCKACARISELQTDHREMELRYQARLDWLRKRYLWLAISIGAFLPGVPYHLAGKRLKGFLISAYFAVLLMLLLADGPLIKPLPSLKDMSSSGLLFPVFIGSYAIYLWRAAVTAIRSTREET
ncbi:MAG TPA: tetratricopeptide repeat protein [Firmicutes bacterium]|nr:tetratricopeptide repeat protein [Bacillota bacterium]